LELLANNSFLRPARQLLSAVRHLSPVREDDSRKVVERANPPADEVGHFGEHTIYHLYRILNREGAKADFVKDSIQRIANIDDLEFRKQAREFTSHFRGRNVDTGARCYLKEFGFGVSQCIPIFVQGVLLQKGQLLMVEQPEAQLHPTAQLELGSFFADLWRQFGVPSLVETHSDNLFLRLRKLVRQKKLPSSDVSIAYFCVEDRAVSVKNLDIMDDGRIGAGLPMEFFGADLLEVLDMH
jgi:predicted ATPase